MCHITCLWFEAICLFPSEIYQKDILDVGSQDLNGSFRPYCEQFQAHSYIGLDQQQGKGVDVIGDASDMIPIFGENRFDVVICSEMLEHAKEWQAVVSGMKRVCRPGGVILITTRGPGFPRHEFPNDYWRFQTGDLCFAFGDCVIEWCGPDTYYPGVFLKARKPVWFREIDISQMVVMPAPDAEISP